LAFLAAGSPAGSAPLPQTTALAMHAVPFAFTGVVGAMAAVNWIINRRMKRESEGEDD
jgi:hypothetical protein